MQKNGSLAKAQCCDSMIEEASHVKPRSDPTKVLRRWPWPMAMRLCEALHNSADTAKHGEDSPCPSVTRRNPVLKVPAHLLASLQIGSRWKPNRAEAWKHVETSKDCSS